MSLKYAFFQPFRVHFCHKSAPLLLPELKIFTSCHRGSRFVGLYWTQLDYECMRKALTDVQREKFASLLVDYRTGESKVVEAVSSEKL